MKSLRKYPRISTKTISKEYDKNHYVQDRIVRQLKNGYILTDFNQFVNYNHITNFDENTYRFYLDSIFGYNRLYQFAPEGLPLQYTTHFQQAVYWWDITHKSWDVKKLVERLSETYQVNKVSYAKPKRQTTQATVTFNVNLNELFNDPKFWSLVHMHNFYIKEITGTNIVFEPYRVDDVSEKIYNDLNGILYHITTKENYVKGIRYRELAPEWNHFRWDKLKVKPYDIWKENRIFFTSFNLYQISSIIPADINNQLVLKIDLNDFYRIRFKMDSCINGIETYFCDEPIPDFCITVIDPETGEEIDKKTL